jgi:N-acyl-D-aspartate/D-glutamate deacylase
MIEMYDRAILNGRVIDPESGLDAIRNLGIRSGVIQAIDVERLAGRTEIDASGLIVAPGFIDLNAHGHDHENYCCAAMDGVTTSLALEAGTADVDRWYAEREGQALIHYGASVGHMPVRMAVMHDPGDYGPSGDAGRRAATDAEIERIAERIERGLARGALAVGLGIQYTPAASPWEILEVFRIAARHHALCYVHVRYAGVQEPTSSTYALEEVIAASAITGAPLQMTHVQSSGGHAAPRLLQMIGEARSHGLDVTVDFYPYPAAMTMIETALFDEGWQVAFGIDYGDLQWAATGERLTAESFERYRKTGGWVILHLLTEDLVRAAAASPLTMVATDGYLRDGKGHPRTAGTYSRILGRYVRQAEILTWMQAIDKMTLMPARRLEQRVPAMANKGRIRVGADADLTVFDPGTVIDRATYQEPARYSEGIRHVLVGGVPVVREGQLREDVRPGRAIRAPIGNG